MKTNKTKILGLTSWLLVALICALFVSDRQASAAEVFTILAEDDYFPYSRRGPGGRVEGISVDLILAAFEAAGADLQFKTENFDRAMAKVRDGKAVACFNTPREKRIEGLYAWPRNELYTSETIIYARRDHPGPIGSIKDMAGKKIGLTLGYGYGDELHNDRRVIKEWGRSDKMNMRKLAAGRVDFVAQNKYIASRLMAELGVMDKIKAVGKLPSDRKMYLVFSKKHPRAASAMERFDRGFDFIKQSGLYQRIFNHWEKRLKDKNLAVTDP